MKFVVRATFQHKHRLVLVNCRSDWSVIQPGRKPARCHVFGRDEANSPLPPQKRAIAFESGNDRFMRISVPVRVRRDYPDRSIGSIEAVGNAARKIGHAGFAQKAIRRPLGDRKQPVAETSPTTYVAQDPILGVFCRERCFSQETHRIRIGNHLRSRVKIFDSLETQDQGGA